MMMPLVRRTWAPRGKTPVLRHQARSYKKISAMGAVVLSPRLQRARLLFRCLPDKNFGASECVAFLRQLEKSVPGPVIVVWDRLNAHRSKKIRRFIGGRRRIELEYFPPYAPDLNPIEFVWSELKAQRLANHAPDNFDQLRRDSKRAICSVRQDRQKLRRIIARCRLLQ